MEKIVLPPVLAAATDKVIKCTKKPTANWTEKKPQRHRDWMGCHKMRATKIGGRKRD